MKKVCYYCGLIFNGKTKNKFCSKNCYYKYKKGKPNYKLRGRVMSVETRKKMSIARIGKKPGNKKGYKISKEASQNLSRLRKGILFSEKHKENLPRGANHHNWKGGITKNIRYISWIKNKRNRLKQATCKELGTHTFREWELLKKQYNYTCPCCGLSEPFIGQKSENLTEDHIIPLSKCGSDLIENIQPLCLDCNIKKHTKIIKY